jgi:hypothetical protein
MKTYSFLIKLILPCLILFTGLANAQYCYNYNSDNKEKFTKNSYPLPLSDSTKHKKKNKNGFYFGVNLGFYFANRYTAQYYNGSSVNKVDSVIKYLPNYTAIKQALGDTFYFNPNEELPSKMKYSPAFLFGLYAKYNFKNSGIFMQFNFSKLRANDVFTIYYYDPLNPSIPIYKQEVIWGGEQRTSIDVGYSYTFSSKSNFKPFIQFGANLTNTKFLENKIKIEGLEYSIANYYYTYYNIERGGIGFGGFAGGGINMIFGNAISVMPTLNIYYIQAKMGNLNKSRLNYTFSVTAILNGLL